MLNFLFSSSDKFPPFRVDVTVLFGDELVQSRGHKIDWFLQSEEPCETPYETQWKAGRVWVAPTDPGTSRLKRLRKHFQAIAHSFRVIGLARKNDYDFLQSKDQFVLALPTLLAAKLSGRPFVYWLSYPFPEASHYAAKTDTARYPFLYRVKGFAFGFLLYRVLLPAARHAFVQSEQMKRDIVAEGIPESKLTAVPMGVSSSLFEPPAEAAAEQPNSFVYLGTLIRERKLDFLVRVLATVREQVPDAHLYLVGDGDDPADAEFLRQEIASAGLEEAVTMTGFLPQEEALEYVRKAAVCVSPFFPTPILNSTSPTKVVEYMAMGKPVVANDHPEQRLVIGESGGGICTEYQEAEFAEAIVRLFADPQQAQAMGQAGRQWALENRSYKRIADTVERRYLELQSDSRP
jgi:glycosyltransferase involved in cell wall biosynthesis